MAVSRNRRLPRTLAKSTTADGRSRWVWAGYGGLLVFMAVYLVTLLLRPAGSNVTWLDGWSICAVELVASGLCLAAGIWRRASRPVAFSLAAALFSWTLGDFSLTIETLNGAAPTPSVADIFYIGFYPFAYTAVVLFLRGHARELASTNWMDGAIAGCGAAALCAAFAFHDILKSSGQGVAGTVTNLAYPIGDVLLLALVAGGFAALSQRRRASWMLLAAGMALNVAGDTSNLLQNSLGASRFGVILNAVAWPTAIIVISMALWLRQRTVDLVAVPRKAGFVLPNVATVAALVVLVAGSLTSMSPVAVALATVTLLIVGVRTVMSVRAIQIISSERHTQSVTDELTGLHNRRHLSRVFDAYFGDLQVSAGRSLAFLFVDLNRFKEINDSFGHPAGDAVLRQLGTRLLGSLRETDLLVRLGGDEFAVVLIDGSRDDAAAVAERLTDNLKQPFTLDAVTVSLDASIGIAMAPDDATKGSALMWCADVAMYRAKMGNVPFAFFEQELDGDRDQMRLLEELRVAIDNGGLVLHYQPQLDLRSSQIVAVEALLRWSHPRLGLVPPIKFLPIAEEAGLMSSITRWVLNEATSQCAEWRAAGRDMSVSVNITPSDLLQPGFVDLVTEQLRTVGLPAKNLVIEITETSVITDFTAARRVIQQLRELGAVVSIDDFGAGATSLAYLSNLAVGELKLDRQFVSGLVADSEGRDLDLVRSTIELGHRIGLRIVAEGIEDQATLDLLIGLGCDIGQGYGISKPKPASDFNFRVDVPGDAAA